MLGIVVFTIGKQAETYIANHIEKLAPHLTVVCSLSLSDRSCWTPAVRVTELSRSRFQTVEALRQCVRVFSPRGVERIDQARFAVWLRVNSVSVVLCEYLQIAVSIAAVCERLRVPLVAHAHGRDISAVPREQVWAARYKAALPRMQEIIVVSEAMRSQVLSFGVSANRVHVIACGADLETGCTRRANHAKPVYKVVAVGRLVAKKGPMFLLEAFRQIRDKGVCATLFVIGDGPFLEPMRQYIRAVKLEDCVHLLGALSHVEVKRHLSDADLFLQHSVTAEDGDEEGLPVSIMEAMAASIPVVSTRHAGIPELVTDGLTGFLVEPGDSSDMADRGAELLTDDALRSKMGDAGRRAVADKFSADRSISELRAVLARYCPGLTAHASRPPACLL